MFYTKYNATSGYIDINILNAGYKGNLDFKLEGKNENSCSFTQTISKPIYRQISLSDPFIKDLWETDSKNIPKYDYDYYYEMGKQNIENIRKDTKNKGADSYLGSKCEFTTDNKYICLFTRNQTDYGESDQKGWFNTAKFNR